MAAWACPPVGRERARAPGAGPGAPRADGEHHTARGRLARARRRGGERFWQRAGQRAGRRVHVGGSHCVVRARTAAI